MIDITQLTDRDIGRRVRFVSNATGPDRIGEIIAWTDTHLFVQVAPYDDALPIRPGDLVFLEDP